MTLERREMLFFGEGGGSILSKRDLIIFDKYYNRGFKWMQFDDVGISEVAELLAERFVGDSFTMKIEFGELIGVKTTMRLIYRGRFISQLRRKGISLFRSHSGLMVSLSMVLYRYCD